jgi:PIN domain nuclease of toxin-antitoxin system
VDLLLDTHVALWWAEDPSLLTPEAATAIADPTRVVWFTVASAWELSIKVRSGKLNVDVHRLVDGLQAQGIRLLGIGVDEAISAGALDWAHRDPFDRMIAAQAIRDDLSLVTRDHEIRSFVGVRTIEA